MCLMIYDEPSKHLRLMKKEQAVKVWKEINNSKEDEVFVQFDNVDFLSFEYCIAFLEGLKTTKKNIIILAYGDNLETYMNAQKFQFHDVFPHCSNCEYSTIMNTYDGTNEYYLYCDVEFQKIKQDNPKWCPLKHIHELPEKCPECSYDRRINANGGMYGYECVFTHKYTVTWGSKEHKEMDFVEFEERPDWCPLIKIMN